jgi:hypothetical protein
MTTPSGADARAFSIGRARWRKVGTEEGQVMPSGTPIKTVQSDRGFGFI